MGLEVKRNAQGKYKVIDNVTDREVSDGWVDETEARRLLLRREVIKSMLEVIRVAYYFPNSYLINGKFSTEGEDGEVQFLDWQRQAVKSDDYLARVQEKYAEIMAEYKLKNDL